MLTKGLSYKRFDLHVHTPASDDHKEKTAKPEDIVKEALNKGLSAIAITDHLTGEWIDKIKDAAKGTNLTVFPGIEIKVTGGKNGVELVVLFNICHGTEHVTAFLNKLGVYEHKGKTTIITKTVNDVASELRDYDNSAILILAHSASTHGVCGDMTGEQRSSIFKAEYSCLLGAETNESDFSNTEKKTKHTRIIDLFDGHNLDFHNKKLGVYQVSDAHTVTDIGSKYTFFKVDENISIEDIKQSLQDRETRIRQSFEYKETVYPYIRGLKIKSGFLDNEKVIFHEGLNSLLGAKGSGKSLIIEFLRFCLNQEPQNEEISNDHESKLEMCLKTYGELEVIIVDESGKEFLIKRTYNPAEDSPIEIIDLSDKTEKEFAIEQLFPVLFLSQNEIIKIAEDKTGASQRMFIDKFFDFYRYQEDIELLNNELMQTDERFAEAMKAHLLSADLKKKILTCKAEIEKLNGQIKNSVFTEYSSKEKIGQAIQRQMIFLKEFAATVSNTVNEFKGIEVPVFEDKEIAANPAVKRINDVLESTLKSSVQDVENLTASINKQAEIVKEEYKEWHTSFEPIKTKYETVVKETGGTQVALDQKRKLYIKNLAKLESEMTSCDSKAKQIKAIASKRDTVLKKIDEAYKAYYEERKKRCEYFTNNSGESLRVEIKEREDTTAFKNNMMKFKKGSWLKDDEIEKITALMSPREFVDALLRFQYVNRSNSELLSPIVEKTKIKPESIERLANHLLDEYELKEITSLLYTSVPNDVPSISYRVGVEYKPLKNLSVGQKAVALLIIALSEGKFPIVIDQPEDSLDLRSIWDDMCIKIRDGKEKRQFIFTTHNSSVAVASDSDKFIVLQADATHGTVTESGSINIKSVKDNVVDYLEGGQITYKEKQKKYGI